MNCSAPGLSGALIGSRTTTVLTPPGAASEAQGHKHSNSTIGASSSRAHRLIVKAPRFAEYSGCGNVGSNTLPNLRLSFRSWRASGIGQPWP
jgi:hypothetical protein